MKCIAWLLSLCLLMTACSSRKLNASLIESEEQQNALVTSAPEGTSGLNMSSESQGAGGANPAEEKLDEQRLNEIMCIFGAERKVLYDGQGLPIASDAEEYQTSVISFYYDEQGISSVNDITPYGFFGWYLQYTLLQEDKVAEILPGFERTVLVRNDPISGEIYGAPGDAYERIVTSFFDVDVQQLRGDDLYDEKAHAYVPITGPGRGEQPTVRVAAMKQQNDLIVLDILVEGYNPLMFQLTVRKDQSNELAGIKFVSLLPKTKDDIK